MIIRKIQCLIILSVFTVIAGFNFPLNSKGNIKISSPENSELKIVKTDGGLNAEKLLKFNQEVLGLNGNKKATVSKNFIRPGAIVVFSITGMEGFNFEGTEFEYEHEKSSNNFTNILKNHFGDEFEHAYVDSTGIFGSKIAEEAKKQIVDTPKHITDLIMKNELINMYKLAKAIEISKFDKQNSVDYYNIHFDATSSVHSTSEEEEKTTKEIKQGIADFHSIAMKAYNRGVVFEIYTHVKQAEKLNYERLNKTRVLYQVTRPRHIDDVAHYPILAISCFIFVFASIAVIILFYDSSDMAKNSIAYKLTERKAKKQL